MKIKNDKEKNNVYLQDINANDKTFKFKIFKFFYSIFHEKKEIKSFFKFIQIFIETIQFISYAFSSNHYQSWKIETKKIAIIAKIVSAFRLSYFMYLISYSLFAVILYLLIALIFIVCLITSLNILFIDSPSKFYQFSAIIIRTFTEITTTIFFIPIIEIILLPNKCTNGKVYGFLNGKTCWVNIHLLDAVLGILGTILLFVWDIFVTNFNFYPFQNSTSANRIDSSNEIKIIVMKIILVLQFLFISNEIISLFILLLISIYMFVICYNKSIFNNDKLEMAITIRNSLIFWTYFVLLISKLFINVVANGFIYLLAFGYPIIVYLSIIIYREKEIEDFKLSNNPKNIKDYLKKVNANIKLINSFIERNINIRNGNENEGKRNIILLRGNIKIHNVMCTDKDCPLTKFINNEGNFNIQKQCLLNYMNIFFNKGLKTYSNNIKILAFYIYFNYSKRFNLNSVRTNLLQLKKMECGINDKFVAFCLEQNIKAMKNNGLDFNSEKNQENDSQIDLTEQKYQKLKYLIENSVKLYGEFWGIFSTNISSNINTSKLYSLGEILNIYLNEMNHLWENELKNKRMSNEYQSIVQLYSKFLLEILWDKKKSKQVYKKLNDENLNNYYQNNNIKSKEDNNNSGSLEELVDNQDFILFADYSSEKSNCKIIQLSSSLSHYISYQKNDIIAKPLEIIFPNILIENYSKFLEESIKELHNGQNNKNDLSYSDNDSNKNSKLIIVKSRIGYIIPLFASFKFLDDNDYSDSFLIKIKLENKESKSEYAYFILTNPDFSIENISSSAINLGLSLDLLKKYLVKMDILVRTNNNKPLNIYERVNEFNEEPKVITWIFPEIIYPKDNMQQNKEEEIEELIEKSNKKQYNLQIKIISFNENEQNAYLFKFTEIVTNKNKKKFNEELYIPKSDKNLITFFLMKLNFVRTKVVNTKTGLRNLDYKEQDEKLLGENNILSVRKKKKRKELQISESESSENQEKKINILTKEKILELQVFNYIEIKNFIYSLPIYGSDVALERFRPNKDRYSASKITESLIKIQINQFCKRIDERAHFELNNRKKRNKNINENNNLIDSPKSANTDNYLVSTNSSNTSSLPILSQHNINNQGEDLNKGLSSDSSTALANIFKSNSIKYIKILINITFLFTLILLIIEFLITYKYNSKLNKKINFLQNAYTILTNMLYTKHYVTEGVFSNYIKDQYYMVIHNGNLTNYLNIISKELAKNRQKLTEIYDTFTSDELCQEFQDFMKNTKITIYTLTINSPENLTILFNNAMARISSSVNDLVSNPSLMIKSNRDTYELMHNLINEFYINWYKVIEILLNDSIKTTKINDPLLFILIGYLLSTIIILFIFLKLLSIFSLDREKPINLFLTLKKVVFENLKNSAENFSNKLLNKFFGNEDNEEEAQQDYQANIQPNDINIIKFKAINEYNVSIMKAFYFIQIIFIIIIFLLINLVYFIVMYFDFTKRMNNISQFIILFDKTNIAQSDYILSVEIFRSYIFNKTIPILNSIPVKKFMGTFLNLTSKFEDSIIYISKTKSFLSGEFLEKYEQYYLGDYTEVLDEEFFKKYEKSIRRIMNYGIKPIESRVFEIIRYFIVTYIMYPPENDNYYQVVILEGGKMFEMNVFSESINRKWFDAVIDLMIKSFQEYSNQTSLYYIILFVGLIVVMILYYFIVWRIYEEKLIILLKGSADLINLIPQEIKNIIIEKINE